MLKRPDNRILLLTAMFLIGLVMITIPLIQQHKEIEDDNSIYAMIAEEIRHQQEAASASPVPSEDEEGSETEKTPAELSGTHVDGSESEEEDKPASTPEPAKEPVEESNPLPAMLAEVVTVTEEPGQQEVPENTALPTAIPQESALPIPTQKPANTAAPPSIPQNKEYVAWISIPGTVIDYPVVRSDRSEYYLHHLITGQESKLGTLFSLTTSDYLAPSRNIAIYGHHLSNSTAMFSTLLDYKKESYWKNHQTIQVDSIYGSKTYRIFAVLNHTVSDWDASTASFADDRAFLKFVNRAKKNSFYDTGITVSEDDHIITLITCDRSYGGVQGRLLVMGVQQ